MVSSSFPCLSPPPSLLEYISLIPSHALTLTALARLSLIFSFTSTCIFFLLRSIGTQVNELIKPPYRETLVNVIGSICNFALDWGFDFFFATVYSEYVELPTQERLTAAY